MALRKTVWLLDLNKWQTKIKQLYLQIKRQATH